jgi:hypothetical protein
MGERAPACAGSSAVEVSVWVRIASRAGQGGPWGRHTATLSQCGIASVSAASRLWSIGATDQIDKYIDASNRRQGRTPMGDSRPCRIVGAVPLGRCRQFAQGRTCDPTLLLLLLSI